MEEWAAEASALGMLKPQAGSQDEKVTEQQIVWGRPCTGKGLQRGKWEPS